MELKKLGVLRPQTKVWTSKYLNNLVEQDHRRVEAADLPDARLQQFQACGSDDQRDRASAEDREGAVRHFSGDSESRGGRRARVGSSARRMTSRKLRRSRTLSLLFAPEPSAIT